MTEEAQIRISRETRRALLDIGRKGETYDAVIRRLLQMQREYEETGGLNE